MSRYVLTAGSLGAAWAALAIVLDGSTEADHSWAIPWQNPWVLLSTLVAGALTGLLVSSLFEGAFVRVRRPYDLVLPLITIPFALAVFGSLIWCIRMAFGYRFTPEMTSTRELGLIVTTYLVYGCLSLAGPFLYLLAVVTQRIARSRLEQAGV